MAINHGGGNICLVCSGRGRRRREGRREGRKEERGEEGGGREKG